MKLVTVTVGTHNSSQFVVKTLESIYNQTWKDIELIIKDDASTDNTVELCRKWIEKNNNRFIRTEILAVSERKGPAANFNRGIRAAKAEWIKPVAGDDALLPNCIQDNMDYVSKHPETKVLFSQTKVYRNKLSEENF